jgi:DNA transposition AAA+ family ATPase
MPSQHLTETVGDAQSGTIRLDDPTIQTRCAAYPAPMLDATLWLAGFIRGECNRDLDILTEFAGKLGISFDKTTWSKILRGRWNRDAEGNPTPNPIVAESKFLKAIDLMRRDLDLREQAGKVPFIMTPTAECIFAFIDKKRAPDRVNKFGLIIGHTGTQKTATLKEYCRRNNHGTCVHVEAPDNGSRTGFITDLADRYGASRQSSWDRKINTIRASVNERRTIIVENVQRLYIEKDGANQKVFNFLQKLQDDTGCCVILTFTPVFATRLKRGVAEGYFEQFIGRAGGQRDALTLPEFPTEDDVLAICQSFKLRDAEKHLDDLVKIAREEGRVRVLFEALQEAKVQCERRKAPLTMTAIRAARGED